MAALTRMFSTASSPRSPPPQYELEAGPDETSAPPESMAQVLSSYPAQGPRPNYNTRPSPPQRGETLDNSRLDEGSFDRRGVVLTNFPLPPLPPQAQQQQNIPSRSPSSRSPSQRSPNHQPPSPLSPISLEPVSPQPRSPPRRIRTYRSDSTGFNRPYSPVDLLDPMMSTTTVHSQQSSGSSILYPPSPQYETYDPTHQNNVSPQSPLLISVVPRPTAGSSHSSRDSNGSEILAFGFRSTGFNSMVLFPLIPDPQPWYHISIAMNCFNPTSYITTVRRGGGFDGEVVADFEMGISSDKATLSFGGQPRLMEDTFHKFRKVPSKLKDRWAWERNGIKFQWDGTGEEIASRCYFDNDKDKKVIARISPASVATRAQGQSQGTVLEVYPAARSIIDDIVVSCLIVERKRLAPSTAEKGQSLFN